MARSDFSKPTLDQARERLSTLLVAYMAATGFPETTVGRIARNDPKCFTSFRVRDFQHASYDLVVSRFSALWPEGCEWPASVPRQAPAEIDAETLKLIADRHERTRTRKTAAPLPGGATWPSDIPQPAANPEVPTNG